MIVRILLLLLIMTMIEILIILMRMMLVVAEPVHPSEGGSGPEGKIHRYNIYLGRVYYCLKIWQTLKGMM